MAAETDVQEEGEGGAQRPSTLKALAVYLERRSLVMLALGFASGLPNLLIFDTLSGWLRDAGLSLEVIGFFSLATLSYSLKFLWAPLVDRAKVPVLTAWLGHRRSWMLVCQALIILGLWGIAAGDPVGGLGGMALLAVLVGFVAATQDIVIDAWRIEAAVVEKQGPMAAAYQWGYRIAVVVAGAVPLILSDHIGWNLSYGLMAALMAIGVLGVLGAPREEQHIIRTIDTGDIPAAPLRDIGEWLFRLALIAFGALLLGSGLAGDATMLASGLSALGMAPVGEALTAAWSAKPSGVFVQFAGVITGFAVVFLATRQLPGAATRPGRYLSVALDSPLVDFFGRYGKQAGLILALICVYRLSDSVLNIMTPFYLDMGFDKLEIAEIRKGLGVIMSVIGVGLGGLAVVRLGLIRALIIGAFAGPISNLIFAWLAMQGPDLGALAIAIAFDNIAGGFSGTCLIAYMSSLTAEGFTATQYALFSSLYSLLGKLLASQSGRIVEGAAASAGAGGAFAPLQNLFLNMPPETFAAATQKSGVGAAALGAGYVTFFIYSALIGVAGVILTFVIAANQPKTAPLPPAGEVG